MPNLSFPFAVRLIGFSEEETEAFATTFAHEQGKGYEYFHLAEDNLQDPDLYIANASELKALAALVDLRPSDLRPALLIGKPVVDLPYRCVERPLRWDKVFHALDTLVEKRADALSRLEASDVVRVPERRRRERIGLDLTDPAEYVRMRAKLPDHGAVLVVDKNPVLRDYLAELLMRWNVSVAWASEEAQAIDLCTRQAVAAVVINTSVQGIDPYSLCRVIRESNSQVKISVIFLVGKPADYDIQQARAAGADGYLTKPLTAHQLVNALKKFLPFIR